MGGYGFGEVVCMGCWYFLDLLLGIGGIYE